MILSIRSGASDWPGDTSFRRGGGVFALCYFDEEKKSEVNAVEIKDAAIAYHFENALLGGVPPAKLENSVNDYLAEEKRIIEAKWNENKVIQPSLIRVSIRQWRGTHKKPMYTA